MKRIKRNLMDSQDTIRTSNNKNYKAHKERGAEFSYVV